MSAPDFSQKTKDIIAYRSAHICANPDCNRLTIAPSIADKETKIKIGEAAHIHDARKKTIRWKKMSDVARAKPENGIWLCASCHTEIDKNQGQDYPASTLKMWKTDHEELMFHILKKHKSPLPLLRRLSNDAKLAQQIVDLLADKGAFYMSHNLEVQDYVIDALVEVRKELQQIGKKIDFEKQLVTLNNQIKTAIREYMNYTSKYPAYSEPQMEVMRLKVGICLKELRDDFDCTIPNQLAGIIPN
ncbi:hypothetical protein Rhal01_00240 [Rubritalea halochordaticola]|uniref:HNH endonuclease n=1 Tax=Rubritalea halochordaticola TaxID=714537 RepID=A0ABP9UUD7_9BACT